LKKRIAHAILFFFFSVNFLAFERILTNLLPVKNSSDEKIFLLTLSLILCIPITAQQAIRKELGNTEVLKFTAYHITESGEYLFIMNANNSK